MQSDLIDDELFVSHFANIQPNLVPDKIGFKDDFSIFHINARSLNFKMGQLELLLSEINVPFSCIVISETWFSHDTFLGAYNLLDYQLFCSSRPKGNGGGVAVYVNKKFEARVEAVRLEGSDSLLVHIGEDRKSVV